ncbi:MAG: DUF445 family protein [Kofleriaceae bacterium]|nr:DUF445 family protein [Kofleriaceae bacterium]
MHSFVQILIFLPLVGALIGYVCKWFAIRMLFAPSQFRGIGKLGWQGVVQRRAPKFANGVADTVEQAGVTVEAMLSKISDAEIRNLLVPLVEQLAPGALDAGLDTLKPGISKTLPAPIKAQLLSQIQREIERVVTAVLPLARQQVAALVDVRALVVKQLSGHNANRLARLFQTVGARELRVVVYYGAVLGFLIGLLEVGFYAALERWWLLPLIGAIDGLVNNWLAIQMIFRPLQRKRYLGVFPFQGLFPARQHEIARDYGVMLASEILTVRHVLTQLDPVARDRVVTTLGHAVQAEVMPMVQLVAPMISSLTGMPCDATAQAAILDAVVAYLATQLPAHQAQLEAFATERLAVAATLETALTALPKDQFERVLRGIFEEDEWILVALGAVLGGAIGTVQGLLVLAL